MSQRVLANPTYTTGCDIMLVCMKVQTPAWRFLVCGTMGTDLCILRGICQSFQIGLAMGTGEDACVTPNSKHIGWRLSVMRARGLAALLGLSCSLALLCGIAMFWKLMTLTGCTEA